MTQLIEVPKGLRTHMLPESSSKTKNYRLRTCSYWTEVVITEMVQDILNTPQLENSQTNISILNPYSPFGTLQVFQSSKIPD